MMLEQIVRQEGDERKQTHQDRRSAGNGPIRPLALSFDAQVFSDMAKGGFHLPTALEEDQDGERVKGGVGGEQGLRLEFASDIPKEDKANGDRLLTRVIPDGLMGAKFNIAQLMVIPDKGQAAPMGIGVS